MTSLERITADAPLNLQWQRQGRIWWNQHWLESHGPTRERIPGFDDHVSFANYDLRLNSLPQIQLAQNGQPFVMCMKLPSAEELAFIKRETSGAWHSRGAVLRNYQHWRVSQLRGILDVVGHHGFEPSDRPAFDLFNRLVPPQALNRVDP